MRLAAFILVALSGLRAQALSSPFWITSYKTPVYAGGLGQANWGNDTAVSDTSLSAGSAGVTVLLPYWNGSMYQDGAIRRVKLWVQADTGGAWRLKCYSYDWTSVYTYVGQSVTFTVSGTGQVTTTLSAEFTGCGVGQVLGVFVPHGSALWSKSTALVSTPWEGGDVTTFSAGGTLASKAINVIAFGDPPFVACGGDSICAGHDSYKPPYEAFQASYNIASQTVYQTQQSISAVTFLYQNYGVGSQTYDYVNTTEMPAMVAVTPTAYYIHCGTNDIAGGTITWTTGGATGNGTQGALNGILGQVPAGAHLFVGQVIPRSDGNVSAAQQASFNSSLSTWAAANGATVVAYHDAMGIGTLLGTPNPALYGGTIHPNVAGYTVMAGILATALRTYYEHNLFPLPGVVIQ